MTNQEFIAEGRRVHRNLIHCAHEYGAAVARGESQNAILWGIACRIVERQLSDILDEIEAA
jgi:hypothetical protein